MSHSFVSTTAPGCRFGGPVRRSFGVSGTSVTGWRVNHPIHGAAPRPAPREARPAPAAPRPGTGPALREPRGAEADGSDVAGTLREPQARVRPDPRARLGGRSHAVQARDCVLGRHSGQKQVAAD